MTDDLITDLLGAPGEDPGCDGSLALFDVWAERVRDGQPSAVASPLVHAHLRNCAACREDAEGLLALITADEDRVAVRFD